MGLPVCDLCDRSVQAVCPKRRMRKGMLDVRRSKLVWAKMLAADGLVVAGLGASDSLEKSR